ncbi:MAG: LamG domain-containing protein, partial [Bacteroidota bacterium]
MKYFIFIFISSLLNAQVLHYWKLNEVSGSATYIDEYHSTTDAICSVGCPTQVTGQVDQAQDFSIVQSDLDVPDDDSFDWGVSDSFTIELWMKSSQSTSANNMVMIGRNSGENLQWWIGVDKTNNKVRFLSRDSVGGTLTDISNVGPVITDNIWHHIVVVRDVNIGEMIVYVDGVKRASEIDNSTSGFAGTIPVNIGYMSGDFYYDGVLDEIMAFDSALSIEDIQQHYQNGLDGKGFDSLNSYTAYTDDFSTDTTIQYITEDSWTQGGVGSFTYDSTGE